MTIESPERQHAARTALIELAHGRHACGLLSPVPPAWIARAMTATPRPTIDVAPIDAVHSDARHTVKSLPHGRPSRDVIARRMSPERGSEPLRPDSSTHAN
jgi:hypothetical protein